MTPEQSATGVGATSSSTGAIHRQTLTVRATLLAMMTAFVFVVTRIVSIPLSFAPSQVFDAGDIAIFISSFTFGPFIGSFAGGVGSAFSDASQGLLFAPFTLVIKGAEGFLAGWFVRKGFRRGKYFGWIAGSVVMVVGYFVTNWFALGFFFPDQQANYGLYIAAVPELPFDIAQVVAGGLIGIPVSRRLRDSLPVRFLPSRS